MIRLTDILNESSPGFENRQAGDALPTLASVQKAYQEKKKLEEAESFTAINKDTGKVSVFKSKDARDSAIKQGTHDKKKAAKGGDSPPAGKDTPKVNIFDKPEKEEPKKDKDDEPKDDESKKAPRDEKNRIIVPKEIEGWQKGDRFNDDWYQKTFAWVTNKEQQKVINDLIKKSSPGVVDKLATRGLSGSQIRDGEHSKSFQDSIQKILDKRGGSYNPEDEKSSDEPSKDSANSRPGKPEVNKAVRKKAESLGITPQKLGKEEYESRMSKAAIEALTDSNFHSEARKLIAVLEDKPEWANDPNQDPNKPDIFTPEYEEWQKTSVYSSELYDSAEGTDEIAHEASNQAGWDGVAALDAIAYDLKMNGSKKLAAKIQGIIDDTNESSTQLRKLVPEQHQINEGTRSQVGVIAPNGKIVSRYVHFDGYPKNMKAGLRKHLKDLKSVKDFIKKAKGGARGIFDDKPIEYMKGSMKAIQGNIKAFKDFVEATKDSWAEFVYLFNTKDKKWYYGDTYKTEEWKEMKKLF